MNIYLRIFEYDMIYENIRIFQNALLRLTVSVPILAQAAAYSVREGSAD